VRELLRVALLKDQILAVGFQAAPGGHFQHLGAEIQPGHLGAALGQRKGNIPGAAAQIQRGRSGGHPGQVRHLALPAPVQPETLEVIDEVVAAGNAREQVIDLRGARSPGRIIDIAHAGSVRVARARCNFAATILLALAGGPAEGGKAAMHGILDISLAITGLLAVLALVGLGIFLTVKKQHDPANFIFKLLGTAALIAGVVWFIRRMTGGLQGGVNLVDFGTALMICGSIVFAAIILSVLWVPLLGEWVAGPLANIFDGGREPPERKPFYSIALAKRNRGNPHEAVAEIRRQLEQFPNDFEGVMLLARVQAEDMADLPGAELTLDHFCDWPGAPVPQAAAAYTQLADWHLRLGGDAQAARAALQKIITRFPDTEQALYAEQRIAHLADAEKMIMARQDRKEVAVPEGAHNVGLLDSTAFLKPQEIDPGRLAAAHVKHLEAHPHDSEVRERLAAIYAHDFKRLDLATLELAQLINEPKHKPKQVAHWLNLLANFQVELGAEPDAVRATLEKIVELYPKLPVAEVAQRRLARLENEFKGLRQSVNIKLGTYEQNIGLKYGGPRRR